MGEICSNIHLITHIYRLFGAVRELGKKYFSGLLINE